MRFNPTPEQLSMFYRIYLRAYILACGQVAPDDNDLTRYSEAELVAFAMGTQDGITALADTESGMHCRATFDDAFVPCLEPARMTEGEAHFLCSRMVDLDSNYVFDSNQSYTREDKQTMWCEYLQTKLDSREPGCWLVTVDVSRLGSVHVTVELQGDEHDAD